MTNQAPLNVPIDVHDAIRKFSAEIGGEQLGLALRRPEDWAEPMHCFQNVLRKMERDGGSGIFGWTFNLRFSEGRGHYLIATHHAVWHSHDGGLIDITPSHIEERHRPITQGVDVLFLVHRSAIPMERGNVVSPLPLKFFGVTESHEMRDYLAELAREEEEICQRLLAFGKRA